MMHRDFDPWTEIERLRAAKAAKPAKAAQGLRRIRNFSQGEVCRCRRCLDLESRGIAILLCLGCGYGARPEHLRGVFHSLDGGSAPETLSTVEKVTQEVGDD